MYSGKRNVYRYLGCHEDMNYVQLQQCEAEAERIMRQPAKPAEAAKASTMTRGASMRIMRPSRPGG